jgi:hypothetical protein
LELPSKGQKKRLVERLELLGGGGVTRKNWEIKWKKYGDEGDQGLQMRRKPSALQSAHLSLAVQMA